MSNTPSYLNYTGHGMIERYPRSTSFAHVTAHERRHKVNNQLKALSTGKEVSQAISYKVTISNGQLIVQEGTTTAEMRDRSREPTLPDKSEISERTELFRMNRTRNKVSEKLRDIKKTENRPDAITENVAPDKDIPGKIETLRLKNQMIRIHELIHRLKKEITQQNLKDTSLEKAVSPLSDHSQRDNSLSIVSNNREIHEDNIKLRGQQSIITDSFWFMKKDAPGITLNNGVGSALRTKSDLKSLDRRQPSTFMHIRFASHPDYMDLKNEKLNILGDRLNRLSKSASTLSEKESFNPHMALSSRPSVVKFDTTFDSPDGKYKVKISNIAQGEQMVSGNNSDPFAPLGISGTFKINGYSITVDLDDSLNDIKDMINFGEDVNKNGRLDLIEDVNGNGQIDSFHIKGIATPEGFINSFFYFEDIDSSNTLDQSEDINNNELLDGGSNEIHVTASIERNRLVLRNTSSNAIQLSDDTGILEELGFLIKNAKGIPVKREQQLLTNGENLNLKQQKASIEVNRRQYNRPGNQIDDIITGTIISIKQASPSSVEVSIQSDFSHTINVINSFVESYNSVMRYINEQNLTNGILDQNSTIQDIRSNLSSTITNTSNNTGSGLAQIGIKKVSMRDRMQELSITNLKRLIDKKPDTPSLPAVGENTLIGRLNKIGITSRTNDTLTVDYSQLSSSLKRELGEVISILSGRDALSGQIIQETNKASDSQTGTLTFQKYVADFYIKNQSEVNDLVANRQQVEKSFTEKKPVSAIINKIA